MSNVSRDFDAAADASDGDGHDHLDSDSDSDSGLSSAADDPKQQRKLTSRSRGACETGNASNHDDVSS